VVYLGPGRDRANIGNGRKLIFGGTGNDHMEFGRGRSEAHGGPGADVLYGGETRDWLYGGEGGDLLRDSDGGVNFFFAGPGDDTISFYSDPGGSLNCGRGHDVGFADQDDQVHRNCEEITIREE
jgi:Ca2+-binding RTX toxin-like protein